MIVVAAGCSSGPRAPALQDSPVYQNDTEGFRFLVPEGWSQYARADVPAGPVSKERLLVQYRHLGGGNAMLEVTVNDLPPEKDLAAYLSGPSYGVQRWTAASAPEKVEIGQKPGTRWLFQSRANGADISREVVTFRHEQRVYFFTGVFSTKDASAREQLRKAVGSIAWKN
jgi:hypothetical protein